MPYEIDNDFIDELDDVIVNEEAIYEVWAIGYGENGAITDADLYLDEFGDPDEAVSFAKDITLADIVHLASEEKFDETIGPISYISIEVETVIKDVEGISLMNAGTIFRKSIVVNEEPEEIVELTSADYQIDSFGSMEVSSRVLGDRDLGEKVKFLFADTPEKSVLTYEIIFRSSATESVYYVCDLVL